MATIKNTENWSFETKQLHIGQETAILAQPTIRLLPML